MFYDQLFCNQVFTTNFRAPLMDTQPLMGSIAAVSKNLGRHTLPVPYGCTASAQTSFSCWYNIVQNVLNKLVDNTRFRNMSTIYTVYIKDHTLISIYQ